MKYMAVIRNTEKKDSAGVKIDRESWEMALDFAKGLVEVLPHTECLALEVDKSGKVVRSERFVTPV